MSDALAYYAEITGVETSRFILGHGEKDVLVFTDFHSLCCLSGTSVHVPCCTRVACLLIFHS